MITSTEFLYVVAAPTAVVASHYLPLLPAVFRTVCGAITDWVVPRDNDIVSLEETDVVGVPSGGPLRPKLVCFDFDETITHHHTGGVQAADVLGPETVVRNFRDRAFFVALTTACARRGHCLRVASFADRAFAENRLHLVGGAPLVCAYMDGVLGRGRAILHDCDMECWHQQDPAIGKNTHLHTLLARAMDDTGIEFALSDVILIDDQRNNVDRAVEGGFTAFHCPEGLHREWFLSESALCQALGLCREDFL